MKSYSNFLPLLILIFWSNVAWPVVIGGSTWRYARNDKKLPSITLLECFHGDDKTAKRTDKQRAQIMAIAKKSNAGLAVEDTWNYEGDNKQAAADSQTKAQNKGMPYGAKLLFSDDSMMYDMVFIDVFHGTIELARQLKIPCYNVECRHVKDASSMGYSVTGKEIWQAFRKEAESLLDHSNDIAFLLYPPLVVQFLDTNKNALALLSQLDQPIKPILQKNISHSLRGELLFFGSELVEIRMLHAIDVLQECSHIIMCIGGRHCDKVAPLLKELGYQKVHSEKRTCESSKLPDGQELVRVDLLDLEAYFTEVDSILAKQPSRDEGKKN